MTRHRLAVALLPPERLSQQVDGLRRVLGDRRLEDLPSHLTVVPPVNVRGEALPELRRLLRDVATRSRPFALELGPAATFAPATPTVHLSVGGDLEQLSDLRSRVKRGPLERPDEWPFVAHVTLRDSMPTDAVTAAVVTLSGSLGRWSVDRLYLLEHLDDTDESIRDDTLADGALPVSSTADGVGRTRRWRAVVEEPFAGPVVVGRGGIELVLRTVGMVEPEVVALLGRPVRSERSPLVVVAEFPGRPGEPVAAIIGSVAGVAARVADLHVAEEHQGFGIGRQVASQWCVEAARSGAVLAAAAAHVGGGALRSWGFSEFGGRLLRQLHVGADE